MMFSILVQVKRMATTALVDQIRAGGRPGSQQEGPARDAACPHG
jgi:hypothetical protein